MPNIQPISDYIKAIEAYKAGDTGLAEKEMAAALGIPKLTPYMHDRLKLMVDANHLNTAIVTLLVARSLKEDL